MAARFCSQCGQEVSFAARFCPNCAAPLEGAGSPRVPRPAAAAVTTPAATPPVVTTMDAAAQKSRKLLVPSMIGALTVLAAAVIVLAQTHPQPSLIVSPAPPPLAAPAITNAPATPPVDAPPLTNAPAAPPMTAPAVTNAPNAPAPALPPEVAAYLSFLQGIEQRRIAMNADVSGAAAMLGAAQGLSGGQGMPDVEGDPEGTQEAAKQDAAKQSTQKISQGYSDYAFKWQGLIRDFRATPAPAACTPLAARYLTFLSDYTTVIAKMQVALLNHDSSGLPDLSAVAQVQSQVNTDGAQADTELGNLCAHYGVNKPFTIAPEGAAPSLLGH